MKTKEAINNTKSTLRGIKKVYDVSVSVGEALAWIGLLALAWTLIITALKGSLALPDWQLAAIFFSAVVITFRLVMEGARYFRKLGEMEG